MVVITAFTLFIGIFPPESVSDKINAVILFVAILIYTLIFYIVDYYSQRIKHYLGQIRTNTERIESIEKKMKTEKKFNDFEKRISILEVLNNKKGDIDPRWLMLIGLLVLFYLYLRANGLVP